MPEFNEETTAAQTAQKPANQSPGRTKRFLREVMAELKKTSWMSRDELTKSTVVVVVTIVIVAALLWTYDTVAAKLMEIVGIIPHAGK